MDSSQTYLFKDKRFLPLFIVQFCGCLNDSIIKNALIMLITFKVASSLDTEPYMLVMLANVSLVLPFVIFASLAGQLADRHERATIVKVIKFAEVGIVLFAAYGFYYTNLWILFSSIALMGIHSTFFGPIKYSVLPDQLRKDELMSANGYVEAGTFLSILFGTMIGGFYNSNGGLIVFGSVIISLIGLGASFFMPRSGNANPDIKINPNIVLETANIVKYAYSKNQVYLAILGISWFWFLGAVIIAQLPLLTRETLGADENVATLFLAVFSIGVGVGSFLCNKLIGNKLTTKYVFVSAICLSIFSVDLYFASRIAEVSYQPVHLKSIFEFLSKGHYLRILFDLFFIAAFGGLYVVPLFAVMQYFTSPQYRSRVIAANNLINSFFMAGSTLLLSVLFYMKFSIPSVILIISILNFVVASHIYKLIPNSKIIPLRFWRLLCRILFACFYNVKVNGIENYKKAGKRSVIIANHLSYIDPGFIASYIPENIKFAINMTVAKEWWVRPFLRMAKSFPIEPNNPMAVKSLIEEVKKNKKIAIFPEGRISTTGALMKVYEGPGMIADKADATILPIRVDGTQFTIFSKTRKVMKSRFMLRRKITITILPPVKVTPPQDLDNRERRRYIGHALYNIMSDMMFESSDYKQTLFQSLINSAKLYGMGTKILHDIDNNIATYRDLIMKSFILRELISKQTKSREIVGLMLPNMVGSIITFFGIQSSGRTTAMINFTSGASNIISACQTSQIKNIYTSRKFVNKADLHDLVDLLSKADLNIVYLEDLRKFITPAIKIKGLIGSIFPQTYYKYICKIRNNKSPAVVLFTSGTEGKPKAVVLSHRNIQANRCQALAIIDFNRYDIAFNALPLFHSFGMTVSMIMLLSGIRTFYYPSPLHFRVIPEVIYDVGPTIMFGTDTFLAAYAAHAHPYDFYSLRYVVAGAEKLKDKTRNLWLDKFGIRIFEGYGATEAAPVIAVNTPMYYKAGTVGKILPKIEYHIEPVEGIENGGQLCIKGPNVMLGYMLPEKPGVIDTPFVKGLGAYWYNTGDIVSIDEDRYITILGRLKRFAKVAGEMVSLAAVEELAIKVDEKSSHAAVYIDDDKKGEQIILFTTSNLLAREKMSREAKNLALSELHIPKIIVNVEAIPLLVNGKIDYVKINEMAKEYKS